MIDAVRVIYRCSFFLSFFLVLREFLPATWGIFLILFALGLAYLDFIMYHHKLFSENASFATPQSSVLHTYSIPAWLAWLAFLNIFSVTVQTIPFQRDVKLQATKDSWRIYADPDGHPSFISALLVSILILGCFIPVFLFLLIKSSILYLCFFPILATFLWARTLLRYRMRISYTSPKYYGASPNKPVKTYLCYVPQMAGPASARRIWYAHEIYLDVRMVGQLPQTSLDILQAHEQGHIALGHTNIDFFLRLLRITIVIGTLLILTIFPLQVGFWSGPLAACAGFLFVLCLIAPEAMLFFCKVKWEKEADAWAAQHVGQQAINALRVGMRVNKYY